MATGAQHPKEAIISRVILKNSTGDTFDLYDLFKTINIYEDIFSPFLSADITIDDSMNLQNLCSIVGGEEIQIVFRSAVYSDDKVLVFKLYKISERIMINSRRMIYTLHCISPEGFKNFYQKISRSYSIKPELCVKDILENTDYGLASNKMDLFEYDTADFDEKCALPYQTPAQAIQFITSRSLKDDVPGFLFYETLNGFRFRSLAELTKLPEKDTYYFSGNNFAKREDFEFRLKSIEAYSIQESFDIKKGFEDGVFASELQIYNPITKVIQLVEWDYNKQWNLYKHLEDAKYIPETGDASKIKYTEQYKSNKNLSILSSKLFDNTVADYQLEKVLVQRRSILNGLVYNRINIRIPGDSEQSIGNIIKIELPSPEEGMLHDKFLTGRFIITAIKHHLTKEAYECEMECSKDSFSETINNNQQNNTINTKTISI